MRIHNQPVDCDNRIALLLQPAPLFFQPWWLDAVAPDQWNYLVAWRGKEAAALMPLVGKSIRHGNPVFGMPPLTQALGPWLKSTDSKLPQQLAREKKLMTELIQMLPRYSQFSQRFHYSITNWLPFFWKGFQQTTRYTYVLDNLSCIDKVWDGLAGNIRREIRKARQLLTVHESDDLDLLMRLNMLTFGRQAKHSPYTKALLARVDSACRNHNACKMFVAKDKDGRSHATVYLVWDRHSAYYLIGGADPALRNSGASSLLMWHAIEFSTSVTRQFDFEGSMLEPVERFFRAFGAKQIPYFAVTKDNRTQLQKQYDGLKSRAEALIHTCKTHKS